MKFSDIPSTTVLLQSSILQEVEHSFALRIIQDATRRVRLLLRQESAPAVINWDQELQNTKEKLQKKRYQKVINATGIVIHTNIGRSPIAQEILDYIQEIGSGYCDLEMNIKTGKRGGRILGIRQKLQLLTGAEDALIVNNNAAAIFLVLTALCKEKEVVISRSELVEIGGSFRVPDVISDGGAILKEVGTTNRTHLFDYQRAISENTGALLKVHPSNFAITGFTQKPKRKELSKLAKENKVLFIEDLGSGLLHQKPLISSDVLTEESVLQALEDGVDILTFSGDKLLGGTQAGIILGKKDLIELCRKHPMYRALRMGKISLAALEACLQIYLEGRADSLPIWEMMHRPITKLSEWAALIAEEFPEAKAESMDSYSGGGALPNQKIQSIGVIIQTNEAEKMAAFLRKHSPPILTRIHQEQVFLDPRTLFEEDIPVLLEALRAWYDNLC